MRILLFLFLLIAGWAIIFYPLVSAGGGLPLTGQTSAHPSTQPLPDAWGGTDRLQVLPPGAAPLAEAEAQPAPAHSACGSSYTLQGGDTLGQIANTCGISLSELLAANRQIGNPNQVFAGQHVSIPDPLAGRGGGDTLILAEPQAQVLTGRLTPGSSLDVTAAGLPPDTGVRIGLGLESSGYRRLAEARTDAQGQLAVTVTLPFDAVPGETAFIQMATTSLPTIQRMSDTFTIGW
jgi:LysM repeat protein